MFIEGALFGTEEGEIGDGAKAIKTDNKNEKKKINYPSFYTRWNLDLSHRYFHGGFYVAQTKRACKDTTGKVNLKKGQKLIILYLKAGKGSDCVCRLQGGETVNVAREYLHCNKMIVNTKKIYTIEQVEQWVNSRKINSPTEYLFLVSIYNQKGWILKGSTGSWKVIRGAFKATTGQLHPDGGNLDFINYCYKFNHCGLYAHKTEEYGRAICYSQKNGGNQIHLGGIYDRPSTHGCVGVRAKVLNQLLSMPYGTRVVIF